MERRSEYWFIIGQLVVGGAQRQLTVLATGLRARGHTVRVDVVGSASGPFHDELSHAGVDVHLRSAEGVGRIRFLLRWLRAVRRARPDVVHSYLPSQNALVAFSKPLLRPSKVVWGVRVGALDLSHYNVVGRLSYWLERQLARSPDLTIVNSDAGLRMLLDRGHRPDRVAVVRNGVATDVFRPHAERRAQQRSAWGFGDHIQLFGVVGRLDPAKDHPTFLRAMARLASDRDRRFVCVGGGSPAQTAELATLTAALGIADRTTFAGDVEDMPAAYNALDVLCLSSREEALPNALLEAMSSGVPCAVTDVGDVAIVVDGLIEPVEPGDDQALADAAAAAGEDAELGQRLRARVHERYSDERMVDETVAALDALLIPA